MTIVATPDAAGTPPHVDVEVSVTPGSVMSSVAVWRNDHNGRTLLRTQPAAGFDSRTVTDYECPYGETVTYEWSAIYSGSASSVWDETWANFSSWTTRLGVWGVTAGKARVTTAPGIAYRSVALGKYRVTVDGWTTTTGTGYFQLLLNTTSFDSAVELTLSSGVLAMSVAGGPASFSTIDASAPFTIEMGATSVTVIGTGGSLTLAGDVQMVGVQLASNDVPALGYLIDDVEVSSYDSPISIDETSDPITLDPADAWLVHVSSPGLSIRMSNTDPTVAGIRTFGDVTNDSNTTVHKILGSATPIPTTTGPRSDDETSVTVYTATTVERAALRALLADDIPILIQVPPDWDADFNCGFYQVGEVTYRRDWQWAHDRVLDRYVDLPLTKVQSPTVDFENTGWSYASVAVEFATYSALPVTFATYADLASNSRS